MKKAHLKHDVLVHKLIQCIIFKFHGNILQEILYKNNLLVYNKFIPMNFKGDLKI
jgi:hypothetical protein